MDVPTDYEPEPTSKVKETTTSSSSGPSSSSSYKMPESVAKFVYTNLLKQGESLHFPVFDEDTSREVTDQEAEIFGLEEGTPVSAESLFELEVSNGRKFIGNPTYPKGHENRWSEEQIDSIHEEFTDEEIEEQGGVLNILENGDYSPQKLEDVHGKQSYDRQFTVKLAKSLMGHHSEGIEIFDNHEKKYITVGMGSRSTDLDTEERAKYVRIKTTQSTDNAESRAKRTIARAKAEVTGNDFSISDYEALCDEIGLEPYPHAA